MIYSLSSASIVCSVKSKHYINICEINKCPKFQNKHCPVLGAVRRRNRKCFCRVINGRVAHSVLLWETISFFAAKDSVGGAGCPETHVAGARGCDVDLGRKPGRAGEACSGGSCCDRPPQQVASPVLAGFSWLQRFYDRVSTG